jgi:hypothetical protein
MATISSRRVVSTSTSSRPSDRPQYRAQQQPGADRCDQHAHGKQRRHDGEG